MTAEEKTSTKGPETEQELRDERQKKELRWMGQLEGWEIVKPDSPVTWDPKWEGWLKVYEAPGGVQLRRRIRICLECCKANSSDAHFAAVKRMWIHSSLVSQYNWSWETSADEAGTAWLQACSRMLSPVDFSGPGQRDPPHEALAGPL